MKAYANKTTDTITAAELGAAIYVVERLLTAAVLACVNAGLGITAAAGINSTSLISECRLIFRACEVSPHDPLPLAKLGLVRFGEWDGWSDEALVELWATYRGQPAPVLELCRALAGLWEDWNRIGVDYVPEYADAGALGNVAPLRAGLMLVRLAAWSGLPLDWLHREFAATCSRQDGMGWARGFIGKLRAA